MADAPPNVPPPPPVPKKKLPTRKKPPSEAGAASGSGKPSSEMAARQGGAAVDLRLGEAQILTCSKDSKDRLLMLHDKIKERIDKNFSMMGEVKDDKDRLRCKEMIMMLKMLVGRLQLGIYDSHLMIELCHYLQSYDLALSKCKEEARRILLENGRLRDQIESLSEQAYAKEAQLASTHEMLGYWEFMAESAAIELSANGEDLTQHELWKGIFKSDDRDLREQLYDIQDPERTLYQEIRRLMAANEIHNGIRHMKVFLKSGNFRKCDELANILIVIANYCHDAEMYEDALDALTNARLIQQSLYGPPCRTCAITSCRMAYIHVSDQAWPNAAACLTLGLQDYSSDKETCPLLCKMYFNMGYFLFKMNQPEKAFRAMELSVLALEKQLPHADDEWLWSCLLLSKLLNVCKYYAAACYITCETFQYMLDNTEEQKGKQPVYDIAVAQDEFDIVCKPEDVPAGFNMDPVYQEILGEMKMSFCGMGRIASNDLIDRFIDDVKKHDADVKLTEEQMRQEMSRIMDKNERKKRVSVLNSDAPKSPKKEFRPSPALLGLMQRNVDNSTPLEYKTAENRIKQCKNPIKNLQAMLKQDIQIEATPKKLVDPKKPKEPAPSAVKDKKKK